MAPRKAALRARKPYRPRPHSLTVKQLCEKAVEFGGVEAAAISPRKVYTGAWVRARCQFGCGGYGGSLVCPPHSWKPDETRRLLDEYSTAILVHCRPGTRVKELVVKLEREAFLANYYKAFSFGCGPCYLCRECAFGKGCRHPEHARPAMEASGIDVFRTAREAGFPIDVCRNRNDPQNYYGLVLVE